MTGEPEETRSGAADGDGSPVGSARVLVVDDERAVRDSFEHALAAAGHDVATAGNGGEALTELEPGIDVVLLDRRMPGMSGDELLAHIREWRSDCRVVLVTAVDPDADVVDMTFDDYLVKPVEPADLVETVEQLLLFNRYERLLSEYHAKTRKLTRLKGMLDEGSDNDAVESLASARESVRVDLEATIEAFSDEEIRAALERAVGELS